jgi:hypothetical protein
MRLAGCLLLLSFLSTAQTPNTLTSQEASQGWLLLFDGATLFGWTKDGSTDWKVAGDAIGAEAGGAGWLRTDATFGDYLLHCEFRSAGGSIPGIGPATGRRQPWRSRSREAWHAYDVELSGGRFVVQLDGRQFATGTEAANRAGSIGLEHRDNKVEYRNIKIKPLGLKSIFGGKDLSGWRKVAAPRAKEPAVWSVKDGAIHVEKGPGQLETESQFKDFLLQIDVRTNSPDPKRHPNSGVFFRGEPNGFWTGYEAQILNAYENGDRTRAIDFGTGGIYHYVPARKVVSNDNEWFVMTISARGRRLVVWVNGYPVTNWEDPHPEGANVPNKEAKLTGGTISLQAHDPTTNLDFRNIRTHELSPEAGGPQGTRK